MSKKSLNNTNSEDLKKTTNDLKIFGNPDNWRLLCKASSKEQGWMKSTKIMEAPTGVLVQVTTEFRDIDGNVTACAEAITHLLGATMSDFFEDDTNEK